MKKRKILQGQMSLKLYMLTQKNFFDQFKLNVGAAFPLSK